MDSINRTDLDLRKSLFSNIVLSGGSTLCTGALAICSGAGLELIGLGFGDRLLSEVKKLALKDVKLKIYAPPERKVSASRIDHHGASLADWTVLHMDWWKYLGWSEHFQESQLYITSSRFRVG